MLSMANTIAETKPETKPETRPGSRVQEFGFMHQPGEYFWRAKDNPEVLHRLLQVSEGLDPHDFPCEEYIADCGAESQSWASPADKIESAQFISYPDAMKSGAKLCEECFSDE